MDRATHPIAFGMSLVTVMSRRGRAVRKAARMCQGRTSNVGGAQDLGDELMETIRRTIAETRAQTDASLVAERADTDSARLVATADVRARDDLIEHDRLVADARLKTSRDSPIPLGSGPRKLETERREQEADVVRQESRRSDTDGQLMMERDQADANVSELDETRHALADAQREQERQMDVLGMVTHDLRSPLSVIVLNAENIAEVTAEASTREGALEMTRAAWRMERLLMDLLDVVRIESRTLRIASGIHDVADFVSEVLRSYRPLFAARGLKFHVAVPNPSLVATFDRDRIVQVLSNLLGNAMKFTPAGGAIDLRVERRDNDVQFEVRDSGRGIDANALPHVFERFWQVDGVARRGLGLGLYICKTIVEEHGGRIWAESTIGQGATFRFTLPLRPE
jgi:signal transduction histidine kinase